MIHFSSAVGVPLLYYNSQSADNKSRATKSKVDRARGVSRKENLTRTSSWGRPTSRNPMKTAEEVSAECMACFSLSLSLSLSLFRSDVRRRRATAISPRLLAHSERMEEKGGGEGRKGPRSSQPGHACRRSAKRALTLYELNCSATRKSFITDEALRKLLPISTPK